MADSRAIGEEDVLFPREPSTISTLVFEALTNQVRGAPSSFNHGNERASVTAALEILRGRSGYRRLRTQRSSGWDRGHPCRVCRLSHVANRLDRGRNAGDRRPADPVRRAGRRAESTGWRPIPHEAWHTTCDTLHAHTQVLGKLAVALAPPEPQLQHAALRLSARGWETSPLSPLPLPPHSPRPPRAGWSGRRSDPRGVGGRRRPRRAPSVRPQAARATWTAPLDEDDEHTTYDPTQVTEYFAARPGPPWYSVRGGLPTGAKPRRSTPGGGHSTSP